MATLSHDLTIEISVKDLLRFKCVSKLWCFSIDYPYFIKLHLPFPQNQYQSLPYSPSLGVRLPLHQLRLTQTTQIINPPLTSSPIKILGSCNDDKDRIFLWNPSTRKSQVLPSTEIDFSSTSVRSAPSTYYGFWYEPISDDYKLVRMVQLHGNNDEYFHSEAKVYSLRSNCWRRIKDVCFYLKFNREFGFLANNALHWMVFRTPQSDNRNLVGFDLGSEEFRFVDLPDFCLDKLFWFGIKAIGGDLCLTATYREINNVVVDVW
ncbi:F-box protein CPR30-like [Gossypium australe]|uniref:F-box protein CPR30-like n=1 Tax=Gossypium australe TaxID=47621 RepID=A0A5B6VR56_9ROSI|nr:F-box protein CPR30-like [Gossypium australe]